MIDRSTPVVAGVGQVTQRPGDIADVRHALDAAGLMAAAARRADDDTAAARSLLARVDTVCAARPLSRRYPDPALAVARRLGLEGVRTVVAAGGGNSPQLLVDEMAAAVARGDAEVVLVVGGESMYSRRRARREGVEPGWERPEDPPCPTVVGDDRPPGTPWETAHRLDVPIRVYPLFETALRARLGRAVDEHRAGLGELWARLASVAAGNPLAWSREPYGPEAIWRPSPDNRFVTFPYTKRMCANLTVDQAGALLLCSLDAARAARVATERLVFPVAGADAHDHWYVTERWSLAESPGLQAVARATLGAAGRDVDDVARFDLYSCFPSAVQMAMDALGLRAGDERPVSLTGGLPFFGGPGNGYVLHSIAEAVVACRRDPGSLALVTGVGWYLTKHSAGLYSSEPPAAGFRRVDPEVLQRRLDALPRRRPAGPYEGTAVVEASAVEYGRHGEPERATVAALCPDGRRALATTEDPDVLGALVEEAWEGRTVRLGLRGERTVLDARPRVHAPGRSSGGRRSTRR